MIEDFVNKCKTNKSLRERTENYFSDQIDTYFNSNCSKILKNRMHRIEKSVDMVTEPKSAQYEFKTKIVVPLVKEQFTLRRASLFANTLAEPLIYVLPDGITSYQNAKNMQLVLDKSIVNSNFRFNQYNDIINDVAKYGVGVVVTYPNNIRKKTNKITPVVMGGQYTGTTMEKKESSKFLLGFKTVDPRNYFQHPYIINSYESPFIGYIERYSIADLAQAFEKDKENFIAENLKAIIKEARENLVSDENYFNKNKQYADHQVGIDISVVYGNAWVKDNEEDLTEYCLWFGNKKLIKVHENIYEDDIRPVNIYTIDKRREFWWGNSDIEQQIPMENYFHFALQVAADNALRSQRSFVFFDPSIDLDPNAINNTSKNGSAIPVNIKDNQSIENLLKFYQFPDISTNQTSFILNEVKEASQRVKSKTDLIGGRNHDALNNKTATAANMIEQQGNMQEQYYLGQFSNCLALHGMTMVSMLKQYLGDIITVRTSPDMDPKTLWKYEILGDYIYKTKSSLNLNRQMIAQNIMNIMSSVMSFRGTQDPAWMQVNLPELIREWFQNQVLDNMDINKIYPEITQEQIMQQQQQQMMQQQPQQALR